MSVVCLKDVSFQHPFASTPLWKGINLNLAEGECLLIKGASGVGKSTLLGILAGIVPRLTPGIVRGSVELRYSRRSIVMQNPEAQLVTPTIVEEVAFALENRGLPVEQIRRKSESALEAVGLLALANRSTMTLSGGETQRLSLACALAQDSDIFFLDEPTAYLDPWAAKAFFDYLQRCLQGRTMVIVEHRGHEVRDIISRAVLLTQDKGLTELPLEEACADAVVVESEIDLVEPKPGKNVHIRLEKMAHSFDGKPLFTGLCAEFHPGCISAVMGPSGAGKSTLLKKLAGLLPTAPGTLFWNNIDVSRLKQRESYRSLIYVPQNPEHFFLCNTTAAEWALSAGSTDTIQKAARMFGLDSDIEIHPSMLSEGEKRRLTLALAFLDTRTIVLLDEPTYGLDAASFSALVHGLKVLRGQGRTIIVVTHSPELVRACADDVWYLAEGNWTMKMPQETTLFPLTGVS